MYILYIFICAYTKICTYVLNMGGSFERAKQTYQHLQCSITLATSLLSSSEKDIVNDDGIISLTSAACALV